MFENEQATHDRDPHIETSAQHGADTTEDHQSDQRQQVQQAAQALVEEEAVPGKEGASDYIRYDLQ